MDQEKKIAILIVLYKNTDILRLLLTSLQYQTYNKFKIFALENDPKQESLQVLKEFFHDAICVPFISNLGYACGNNVLAQKAIEHGFQYLFIVNPDVILENKCLENLYTPINLEKQIAIAGPLVYRGTPENPTGVQCFGLKADFRSGKTKSLKSTPSDILQVNMVTGCAFLIRSSAVKKCGLFNEDNFMYGDEIDLAYRLFLNGFKGVVTNKSVVWHNHERKIIRKKEIIFEYYYKTRNRILFLKRYNKFLPLIYDILREIILSPLRIRWLIGLAGPKMIKYYYRGYIDGLKGKKGSVDIGT
jgi:GT2 family glycosyltransferase